MKTFSFRFDIDTPKCLSEGVPNLMKIAERLGVKFTFFISMGHSISRLGTLSRMISPSKSTAPVASALSARTKLGNFGYIQLALFNPQIGRKYLNLVQDLYRSQELGLHGGRNHDTWHHGAAEWSAEKLGAELDWALAPLRELNFEIRGFSCPGWTESPNLVQALEARDFRYRADRHGMNEFGGKSEGRNLLNMGTNILGEPGGVAYLEHLRATGMNDQQMRTDFKAQLARVGDYAVAYDHPYYAGVRELALVEDCVKMARDAGYQILSLGQVAEHTRKSNA